MFNVNQFKSSSKTKKVLVRELMFSDDTAFFAHFLEDMQEIVTRFARASKALRLQVNIKKTEMMIQPPPGINSHHRCIQISGEDLATEKDFKYLDSTTSYNNKLDTELQLRNSKASQAFGCLKDRYWFNRDLQIKTKCAVYSAIVLSTLLYGAESWTVYMARATSLNAYMMRHLRPTLCVKRWHRISNVDILQKTNMPSILETLVRRNFKWAGHLLRLDNTRRTKQILYCQLKEGNCSIGRSKLRFKDTVKTNLLQKGIPHRRWDKKANNRSLWRGPTRRKSSQDTVDSEEE